MKNKGSKSRLQLSFGALFFTLMMIAEIYVVAQMPNLIVLIVGLAVLALISLYLVVDAFFSLRDQDEDRNEEQYENIFKSEKASYLLLKKHFEEIEDHLVYLEENAKVPSEEIINAQKAVAKVVIGRSKENADAIMGSNEILVGRVDALASRLDDLASGIADSRESTRENRDVFAELLRGEREAILEGQKTIVEGQKTINELNEKSLQLHGQNLVVNLKDMELRLNSSIMELQKFMAQTPQFVAAPMPMAQASQPMPAARSMADPTMDLEALIKLDEEAKPVPEPMADLGTLSEDEAVSEADPIGEKAVGSDDIAALFANMGEDVAEEPIIEPEPMAEEPVAEAELEPVAEEMPAMPDLSDSDKPMSSDDIAALLANIEGEAADLEPAAETEPMAEETPVIEAEPEPVAEEIPVVEAESVAEETPAMPDLSDPNKPMSPDDIAALLANIEGEAAAADLEPVAEAEPELEPVAEEIPVVEAEPEPIVEEPVAEEKTGMPDMSDPNKPMSPDDIAALLANMGGDAAAEPVAEEIPVVEAEPEPIVEEIPIVEAEPIVEEPVAEEKTGMPDMSDPNKPMSPDDIAALFANMGDSTAAEPMAAEPIIEPIAEEKPAMPDMSDPNKPMSPDDIAALFANMGA